MLITKYLSDNFFSRLAISICIIHCLKSYHYTRNDSFLNNETIFTPVEENLLAIDTH